MNVLVSACLLGINCKYDGFNNYNKQVIEYLKDHTIIPICPEQLAGFTTPRIPIEILDGRVIRKDGIDVTDNMKKGCEELKKFIELYSPSLAVLKSRSPSCGYKSIYDGTFTSKLTLGNGYACQLILDSNIKVLTEEDIISNIKG